MDLLRLQKALLLARMNADSTYLVDKRAPGYSSKARAARGAVRGAGRGGSAQDRALLRMDDDAHADRASDQAVQSRLRSARRLRAAEEAAAVGAPVSARSGVPAVPHDQRGLDGTQPPGGEHRHQRRSAVESGRAGTAHRARASDGTEEPGAGLPARDGRDDRGEAAGDALQPSTTWRSPRSIWNPT